MKAITTEVLQNIAVRFYGFPVIGDKSAGGHPDILLESAAESVNALITDFFSNICQRITIFQHQSFGLFHSDLSHIFMDRDSDFLSEKIGDMA